MEGHTKQTYRFANAAAFFALFRAMDRQCHACIQAMMLYIFTAIGA